MPFFCYVTSNFLHLKKIKTSKNVNISDTEDSLSHVSHLQQLWYFYTFFLSKSQRGF